MLPLACSDFCFLPFSSLGTFPFQHSYPLPCPVCLWFSSLSSCCFQPDLFYFSSCPFPLPMAPICRTPGIPAQAGFLTLPQGSFPSHPTPSQGSAGLLQTFGVPQLRDHVQQLLRSWKPVLRMQTDARGDRKSSMNIGSSCYEQRQPRHPISCSLRYHQPFRLVKLMHKYLLWCTTATSCAFMRMQI